MARGGVHALEGVHDIVEFVSVVCGGAHWGGLVRSGLCGDVSGLGRACASELS